MDTPLHVAMLITHFPVRQGGAERLLEALIPLLAERGVHISVISRARPDSPSADSHPADIVQVPVRGRRELRSAWYVSAAARHLIRTRPDVVHAHSLLSPTTAALVAAKPLGIPTVTTVHLGGEGGEVQRLLEWKRGGMPRLRALARAVDRIVVINEEIDQELDEVGVPADRRVAIPNGVDTTRFRPGDDSDRRQLLARIGADTGPVAVFVGQLIPRKGTAELVEAWPKVRAAVPDAQLVMLGTGPEGPALQAEAETTSGLHVLGSIDDVAPYLRGADAFVLPSYAEGLSIALLEAMASGLAVITTDVGASKQVLGSSGCFVEPGDADGLASALTSVLSDRELRHRLGEGARKQVEEGYRLADTADRLVTLYRSLADRG